MAAAEVHAAATATEMHATAATAEVATATATAVATTTATAATAATRLRGHWRRDGHRRRQQDCTDTNSVPCHGYLPGVIGGDAAWTDAAWA